MRTRHFEWKTQQVLYLPRLGPLVKPFGITRDADIQRRMDVNPHKALSQNTGRDIPLTVLGGHGGNHHVCSLFGGESCHLGNSPVIFQPGFRGETQIGAKARPHLVSIQKKNRNAPVGETFAQLPRKGRLARATTPEEPEYFGELHTGDCQRSGRSVKCEDGWMSLPANKNGTLLKNTCAGNNGIYDFLSS